MHAWQDNGTKSKNPIIHLIPLMESIVFNTFSPSSSVHFLTDIIKTASTGRVSISQ